EQYGDLKLTVNKFYRINGGSTQNKGVMPDIQFPDPYSRDDFGEQSFETALPWDSIDKVDFAKSDDLSQYFDYLYQRHLSRIQNNTEFQYLIDDISEIQKRHDETTISLNLEERKQKRKDDKDKQLKRENERRKAQGKELIKEIGEDTELVEVDDVKLNEAANIVVDFTKMKKGLLVAQNKADESELKKN
ncbi:MAG: carboxy terminal-processing peptidase, partial [Gammaproteobacteria bacterium]|nr:carboxy terminal-processing peptidase [Gammaproteobacteria bacterium]